MKVFGMMDHRAGGEDLLVLGTHLFDLVRLFGGEANFCSATITKEGEPVIAEDAHFSEKEDIGPVLGDAIHAEFLLDSGVHVSYVSDRRLHFLHGPWGIEFIGTKGKARLFAGQPPTLSLLIDDDPASPDRSARWVRWPEKDEPYHESVDGFSGNDAANRLVVRDWLAAIAEDRDPVCSGENALKCLEMVQGVWQAGATMKRAYFPLANRLHPLEES
jgi:predicted dehydrogenase